MSAKEGEKNGVGSYVCAVKKEERKRENYLKRPINMNIQIILSHHKMNQSCPKNYTHSPTAFSLQKAMTAAWSVSLTSTTWTPSSTLIPALPGVQ